MVKERDKISIGLFECTTPETLLKIYFDIKEKEKPSGKYNFITLEGKSIKVPFEEAISVVKKMRCWGFCHSYKEKNKNIIYYWVDKGLDKLKITELIGHEYAHALGFKSEKNASTIGVICTLVSSFMDNINNIKFKKTFKF